MASTTEFTAQHGTDVGRRLLARARELTAPALRGWCDRLPPVMGSLAGYHFGWIDEHGPPAQSPTGKAVRPALAFACAEAVGGSAQDAVGAAVAVELVHDFSLIHDDIIDRDELRRHRPTVWAVFGIPSAVLAGDALVVLAHQVLASTQQGGRSAGFLAEVVVELVEGEAMDVAFEQRDDVTPAEYLAMAAGKTGALMGGACALGALAGGTGELRARQLADFGRHLGVAFQIVDDLLGIFGDPKTTGKPLGSDLAARKKTYPVLAALGSGTRAGRRLAELYAQGRPLDAAQLVQAAAWVEEAGGRQRAGEAAERELRCAFESLHEADPAPAAVAELTALAHLMTHRSS